MQRKKVAIETACGQHVNSAVSPEDLHKLFVQALNSGDLDGLVALYASDGFLMARSGPARGISAICKALAEYVAMKPTIQLTTRRVVQAGDTVLRMADGDFTEPPAMAAVCQRLAPASKSLVAKRTGVGATSSTSPMGSVNPHAENLRRGAVIPALVLDRWHRQMQQRKRTTYRWRAQCEWCRF
jgi:SnoaL-like protein